MAEYDGSIRINTDISTKMAKKSLGTLSYTIVKTAKEISSLRSKMDALKDTKIPTEEYKKLQSDLSVAEKELAELVAKQTEWEKLGVTSGGAWDTLNEKIATASDNVDAIKEKVQSLADEGKDFALGQDTTEYATFERQLQYEQSALERMTREYQKLERMGDPYARLSQALSDLNRRITDIRHPIEAMKRSLSSMAENMKARLVGMSATIINGIAHPFQTVKKIAGGAIKGTNSLLSKMGSTIKKVGSFAKSAFSRLTKSAKQSGVALSSTSVGFKNILKYGLGIRSLYALFNKLRSAIKDGFGNLYKESDSFKNSVDGLKSSTLTLKNAFAAAFRPLVEIAIPYIQMVVDNMSKLLDMVGQFMAAITGQKTYTKAIKQTTSALEDESKAQNKQLSGLDKLNNLTSGAGGEEDAGVGQMFEEEVPIDNRFFEMAESFKEILGQIFAPLKAAWESQGQFVMDSWKYALEEIGLLAKSVGSDFLEVWNQPETISVLENILVIVGDIGLVAGNLAERFREAWETNDIGLSILENIRDIFGIIIEHIRNATDTTAEWSKNIDFYPLLESINGLLESLEPLADNIGEGLEWFWTNVLLPMAGWAIEDAVPTFLDMLAAAIDSANEVIEALKPLGEWLWDEFLQPLAEWTGDLIISAMETITELLTRFSDWISNNQTLVKSATATIGLFFAAWKTVELLAFIKRSGGVIAALKKIKAATLGVVAAKLKDKMETIALTAMYAKDFLVNIAKGTVELIKQTAQFIASTAAKIANTAAQVAMTAATVAWNAVCTIATTLTTALGAAIAFLTSPIGIAIAAIGAIIAIGVLLYKNWDTISAKAKEVWEFVKKKFAEFSAWLEGIFETDWTETFGALGGVLDGFFDIVGGIWDSIKKIFGGIIDFIAGVFTGDWDRAWNGVVDIFKGIFNLIPAIVEGVLNTAIGIINGLIGGINLVTGVVGIPPIPDIPEVHIPRLATGTVIPPNREFMAVLGDNKREPEVVSPLSTMKQAMLEALAESGGTGGAKEINLNLTVECEGYKLLQLIQKLDLEQYRRTQRPSFQM